MSQAAMQAPPRLVYNSQKISEGIRRLAQGIHTSHPDPSSLALVGIHTGGDLLLRRLEKELARISGQDRLTLDKGFVDIAFYRDDWSRLTQVPALQATVIPFDVEDRTLILIDDVMFTGRTVRAALEAIFSQGRPAKVELAVLVDRGHRELPIQPDYWGLMLPTQRHQSINVYLYEDEKLDRALLEDEKYATRLAG
ncbi:MAG: bifunctional pyr operon transcriptional regulator/uracil phosphoribosyltransferase PyrR [Deltaproteobacteria bacterium]|nr:bifunctional pyr operon transcriptional regulator/uracil phosphoribosyltransferase PyrR [Deltaproteobacteria bacterium]